VLKDLGIWDEVADRRRPAPNGATAMRELAAATGSRPIGCTQATEILATPGIVLVAPLPAGCDLATVYTCAIAAKSQVSAEAAELIASLTGEAARDSCRRLGFV
jgi:molybdate transport system substrate-binding protein